MSRKKNKSVTTNRPDSGLYYETFDNGRVTKATLVGVENNFVNAMSRIVGNTKYFSFAPEVYTTNPFLTESFSAVAKLNEAEDILNEEYGRELAHDRVMTKYHKKFDARMRDVVNDLHRMTARIYHYCEKKGIDISKCKSIETCLDELHGGK